MTETERAPSVRRGELLDAAYQYALVHGLTDLSLRPLAAAIGSSPRVLLFLFGSKDGLVRELLAKAREDELALLKTVPGAGVAGGHATNGLMSASVGFTSAVRVTWRWLADPAHRPLLTLWCEAYARSLVETDGAWADFAQQTVDDWLEVLADAQAPARRRTRAGQAERTLALAVLRGALLDLLATNDVDRTTAAVERHLAMTRQAA
jgi:AcrR family transcriptional regulator